MIPAAALVTNLSVHFKWGRKGSLVWVTTLDEGRPVARAQVSVHDCQGTLLWEGETDGQGIARIGVLPDEKSLPHCPLHYTSGFYDYEQTTALNSLSYGLFVTAQLHDDVSFVHTSWNRGIEPWRFRLPPERYQGPVVAHTVFDRSLLRAGDTVHMMHVLRAQTLPGFSLVPDGQRPTLVSIRHLGSEEKYDFPLQWDAAGVAESTWRIPKEAKLGGYAVVLVRPALGQRRATPERTASEGEIQGDFGQQWTSGQFRVEEFRVPLMKGIIRPPGDLHVGVSELSVDLGVQYLAGGGAGNLPVILRAQIRPKGVSPFDAFEGFTFANGSVAEGIARQGVGAEEEGEDEAEGEAPVQALMQTRTAVHQRQEILLDAAGTARTTITNLPRASTPLALLTEMEFRDPNGEVQTVSTTVPLWPAQWLVGIKPDS